VLCNPFLGNGSVNTFPRQNNGVTVGIGVFSMWSAPRPLLCNRAVNTPLQTIILPVVLYGCETWSLTLRKEHRLSEFENRVLRRIFVTEVGENCIMGAS
jgi:hypothetical protein